MTTIETIDTRLEKFLSLQEAQQLAIKQKGLLFERDYDGGSLVWIDGNGSAIHLDMQTGLWVTTGNWSGKYLVSRRTIRVTIQND